MTAMPTTVSASRRARPDGIETRGHLLIAALRLFAEKGYTKTSTREIARVAGANIGAISYYFGDKAGLYRAVFTEPLGSPKDDIVLYDQPDFTLRQSLHGLFSSMLAPLLQGDLVQQCVRLHFREMVEPTGLWAEAIDSGIVPAHSALVRVLCRHLGITRADDDLHRLAFSVVGLALHIFVARDVIEAIRPKLLATPVAIEQWTASMVDFADAMVTREADRRRTTVSLKKKKP
jgi:AcrR family transcriptional regulator